MTIAVLVGAIAPKPVSQKPRESFNFLNFVPRPRATAPKPVSQKLRESFNFLNFAVHFAA